ncbi:MAG: cytochrome b N-terminal domain-containing protein [Planctomycetia bacterium]|nr:cytochrome b N-terminal domain-containing protein [Planctomycetia bacterium]
MLQRFLNWLEDRTGVITLLKVIGNRRWPAFLMGMKMWPAVLAFLMVIQAITGFILWMHYAPATKSAYESVFYIQNVLWGGWLLRGIHHFSAQCLVAAALFYVLRRVFFGTYSAPREVSYWLALLIFFCGLGACLTGDLLPWTQNGYGATMVRVKYLTQIPLVGGMLYQLAVGGDTVNTITLSHFTALHIGVFAAGLIVLLGIHAICDARAEKRWLDEKLASGEITVPEQKKNACGGCRTTGIARWWSCQAAFNALACLLVMLIVLYLASGRDFNNLGMFSAKTLESGEVVSPGQYLGVPLGPPADVSPTTSFGTARPEWTFRGLYQYALNFAGKASEFVLIFIIPTILVGIFFLMPFIAKFWKYGHLFNLTYTAILVGIMVGLTLTSYRNDALDANYLQAQQEERNAAHRLWELAHARGGLTEQGALAMLQSDWKTQGPKLFAQHCASCHPNAAPETVKEPLAPNLFRYGTKDWIAGWLDKTAIRSAEFYGYKDSPLAEESMVEYVRDTLPEYLADEDLGPQGVQRIIDVLAEEAKLTAPRKMVGEEDEAIPEGLSEDDYYAFEDYGCVGCHPFYGFDGDTKTGPDLTMYASKEWTKKVIADPTKQYSVNDRMLSYHVAEEGSDKNLLTADQLEMLSRWLCEEK